VSTRGLLLLVALVGGAELLVRGHLADRAPVFHAGAWLLAASLWLGSRPRSASARRGALALGLGLALLSLAELLPRRHEAAAAPSLSFAESNGDPQALRAWWDAHGLERRMLTGDLPLTPDSRFAWFSAVVELDELGLRRAAPAPEGAWRIVVAGGSSTFGATLAEGERTWPERLEREIGSSYTCARPVSVRNAGRPGQTLARVASEFETEIAPLAPDLLVLYPGPDALDGFARHDAEALAAPVTPARASRWLAGLERRWRARAVERALAQALAAKPGPDRLRRSPAARRYRRLLVVAREHGIDVALGSLALAVNADAPESAIRFHESVWPETRRLIVANRDHGALLPLLAVAYRAEALDLSRGLDGAFEDGFVDLVHPSAAGNERLARNAARALAPLLGRPEPGCAPRAQED
jgi:lysophospholipase L1-like esterase